MSDNRIRWKRPAKKSFPYPVTAPLTTTVAVTTASASNRCTLVHHRRRRRRRQLRSITSNPRTPSIITLTTVPLYRRLRPIRYRVSLRSPSASPRTTTRRRVIFSTVAPSSTRTDRCRSRTCITITCTWPRRPLPRWDSARTRKICPTTNTSAITCRSGTPNTPRRSTIPRRIKMRPRTFPNFPFILITTIRVSLIVMLGTKISARMAELARRSRRLGRRVTTSEIICRPNRACSTIRTSTEALREYREMIATDI